MVEFFDGKIPKLFFCAKNYGAYFLHAFVNWLIYCIFQKQKSKTRNFLKIKLYYYFNFGIQNLTKKATCHYIQC
ncbi:MAG TPA: hypothetical protein DCZ34_01735 [Clostridiales bacterium]|nr:hypothetical protein [Clostridiales bacterium]